MKIRFSYKDLIIVLGVLVAAIIVIATFYMKEITDEAKTTTIKTTPSSGLVAPAKALQKIINKVHLHRSL